MHSDKFIFWGGFLRWKEKPSHRVRRYAIVGTLRKDGYLRARFSGQSFYVHRLCWEFFYGEIPQGMEVDHIDHDRCNNHPENLRLVSSGENCKNKSMYANNTSGHVGVYIKNGKYIVSVRVDGKLKHVGSFSCLNAAKAASDDARKNFHINHGKTKCLKLL